MLSVGQTGHNWQRSQEVTTELGHMFERVGILFPVYILPENTETKLTYGYWVVDKAKMTDDYAGCG